MLPCRDCAYQDEIPGNCHIACAFNWSSEGRENIYYIANLTPRTRQWFRFPYNYDPTWGPDECPNYSKGRDAAQVRPRTMLEELARFMR